MTRKQKKRDCKEIINRIRKKDEFLENKSAKLIWFMALIGYM